MALPTVKSLADCVDFERTVTAFTPQLRDVPHQILRSAQGSRSLLDLYTSTNPLISGLGFSIFLGAVFLVVSEINRNYSQVDRVWSILPPLYHLHYAVYAPLAGFPAARKDLALAVYVVWGVRNPLSS